MCVKGGHLFALFTAWRSHFHHTATEGKTYAIMPSKINEKRRRKGYKVLAWDRFQDPI